jgi:hypothetical protein
METIKSEWVCCPGKWPSASGSIWLSAMFARCYSRGVKQPSFTATPEGNIVVGWIIGDRKVSILVDLETHRGTWTAEGTIDDGHGPIHLDLANDSAWMWIVGKIVRYSTLDEMEREHRATQPPERSAPPPAPENVYRTRGWFV